MKRLAVILIVTGILFQSCGKDDEKTVELTVDFSVNGYENAAPVTISFINTSLQGTTYLWDFGDGTTSALFNPTHTYSMGGDYLINLTVTGASGSKSVCKLLSVANPPAANKSAFSYFFNKCNGYPVGASFKTVNPASTAIVWDFGTGTNNTSRDAIFQFVSPGDYTLKYSSLLGGVRDTVIRIIRIQ